MINSTLSKIYLENYKLFERQTLNFGTHLNIFDGPNGYGKTSLFDAIELIITGKIERVQNCDSITGTVGYSKGFLAKDSTKDVIIKAEFLTLTDGLEKSVVIAKRIPASIHKQSNSVLLNPKKMPEIIETYILPTFDTPVQSWDSFIVKPDELTSLQSKLFGDMSQNLYQLLYYIQQEDRLMFFKNPEKARVDRMDSLFNISKDHEKEEKIKAAKKSIKSIVSELTKQISQLEVNLGDGNPNTDISAIEYVRLLEKDVLWDSSTPPLETKEALSRMLDDVLGVQSLINNTHWFEKEQKNEEINKYLRLDHQEQVIIGLTFLFYQTCDGNLQQYKERRKTLEFLKEQSVLAEQNKYAEIDYNTLLPILNLNEKVESFVLTVQEYKKSQNSASTAQKALTSVISIREQLTAQLNVVYEDDPITVCKYCGYDWRDAEKLSQQIILTSNELKNFFDEANTGYIEIHEKIKENFREYCKPPLDKAIEELNNDYFLTAYCKYTNVDLLAQARNLKSLIAKLSIDISELKYTENEQQNNGHIGTLISKIEQAVITLPEEYLTAKTKFNYEQIFLRTFNSLEEAKKIKAIDIEQKINYLQFVFQSQQNKRIENANSLKKKKEILEKQIAQKLDIYEKCQKNGIAEYKTQIINKIEIPFYIYCSRILQSYQGGQGVLIQRGASDSIRFVSPGGEHDVLYTMSSGQLSAILLSFSLALNKMFANEGLGAIFIDDPVQCMDDLNMISFVEVLRNEFANSQVIISTHEDGFANYITYKYDKYGIPTHSTNLKSYVEQ